MGDLDVKNSKNFCDSLGKFFGRTTKIDTEYDYTLKCSK